MTEAIDIIKRVIPVATLESELEKADAENARLRAALKQAAKWFEGEGMHRQADAVLASIEQTVLAAYRRRR